MASDDLFSALSKYDGSRSAEDYLTEAFVYVVNQLLANEAAAAIDLVNWLCGCNHEFSFAVGENVSANTQLTTNYGRPDIAVSAPGKLVYIEVKKDAPLHDGQLDQYGKALEDSPAQHKRLVLLTRFATDARPGDREPDHRVRWFEVHDRLSNARLTQPVSCYLRDQLTAFLEESGMAIQRVGEELAPGVIALRHFGNMLDAAIEAAGAKGENLWIGGTSSYFGCWIESNKYFLGIDYEKPLALLFRLGQACPKAVKERLKKADPPILRIHGSAFGLQLKGDAWSLNLEDESIGFFATDNQAQLETLSNFIKECYDRVKEAEKAVGEAEAEA